MIHALKIAFFILASLFIIEWLVRVFCWGVAYLADILKSEDLRIFAKKANRVFDGVVEPIQAAKGLAILVMAPLGIALLISHLLHH